MPPLTRWVPYGELLQAIGQNRTPRLKAESHGPWSGLSATLPLIRLDTRPHQRVERGRRIIPVTYELLLGDIAE